MRPHPRGSSIESTQILDSTLLRWQTMTCSRLVSLTPSGFIGTILPPYSHPHYFESSSQRQPTYVVGKCPTLHPNVEVKASTFSTAPIEINSLFSKLFLNLDTTSNRIKDKLKYSKNSWPVSQKIQVSSTNKRWILSNPSLPLPPTVKLEMKTPCLFLDWQTHKEAYISKEPQKQAQKHTGSIQETP